MSQVSSAHEKRTVMREQCQVKKISQTRNDIFKANRAIHPDQRHTATINQFQSFSPEKQETSDEEQRITKQPSNFSPAISAKLSRPDSQIDEQVYSNFRFDSLIESINSPASALDSDSDASIPSPDEGFEKQNVQINRTIQKKLKKQLKGKCSIKKLQEILECVQGFYLPSALESRILKYIFTLIPSQEELDDQSLGVIIHILMELHYNQGDMEIAAEKLLLQFYQNPNVLQIVDFIQFTFSKYPAYISTFEWTIITTRVHDQSLIDFIYQPSNLIKGRLKMFQLLIENVQNSQLTTELTDKRQKKFLKQSEMKFRSQVLKIREALKDRWID